jgi:hypothetical protein
MGARNVFAEADAALDFSSGTAIYRFTAPDRHRINGAKTA